MTSLIIRQTVHIEQSTRSHRNWQAVYIDTGHSFTSRNVPCRRGKMHSLQGRGQKRKSLDFSRLFRVGGRNRTRTCDPIDVNDVLCLVKFAESRCWVFTCRRTLILLGFRTSFPIRRVFAGWVFIGCSPHFEHRVFRGVFMGVHGLEVFRFFRSVKPARPVLSLNRHRNDTYFLQEKAALMTYINMGY